MLAQLTDISLTGIVLLVVNVLLGVAVGVIGFSVRRIVQQNDDEHKKIRCDLKDQVKLDRESNSKEHEILTASMKELLTAIAAEREARHASHAQLDERVWSLRENLAEEYQPRRDAMRLYGGLHQKVDQMRTDLIAEIKALPCTKPACAGGMKLE